MMIMGYAVMGYPCGVSSGYMEGIVRVQQVLGAG